MQRVKNSIWLVRLQVIKRKITDLRRGWSCSQHAVQGLSASIMAESVRFAQPAVTQDNRVEPGPSCPISNCSQLFCAKVTINRFTPQGASAPHLLLTARRSATVSTASAAPACTASGPAPSPSSPPCCPAPQPHQPAALPPAPAAAAPPPGPARAPAAAAPMAASCARALSLSAASVLCCRSSRSCGEDDGRNAYGGQSGWRLVKEHGGCCKSCVAISLLCGALCGTCTLGFVWHTRDNKLMAQTIVQICCCPCRHMNLPVMSARCQ